MDIHNYTESHKSSDTHTHKFLVIPLNTYTNTHRYTHQYTSHPLVWYWFTETCMLVQQLVPNEPKWLLPHHSFQARAGISPGGRETGREKGSEGDGFKWSSLAHGSHERPLHTEKKHTHSDSGMHANTDGLSCIQYGHTLAHQRCSVIFLQETWGRESETERARVRQKYGNTEQNESDGELWWDGMTGKVKSTADGEREIACVCVCDFFFAGRTPFPAFPACPPTQHMSFSSLLSSALLSASSSLTPLVIVYFVVSSLPVFCVSINVGGMHVSALCAPFQWFLMYFYP